uniref:Adiponectin receptor 1 n=1 Tax=Chelydra serpentina TaxID=8475 RepID=A0A8C3SQT9_CHESE
WPRTWGARGAGGDGTPAGGGHQPGEHGDSRRPLDPPSPPSWGWTGTVPDDADPVRVLTLPLQAQQAMGRMEEFVFKVWEGRWRVFPHDVLPDWLKDNDFLLHGHRPPMPSFRACFRSIFRLHTETGNIWTHLIAPAHLPRHRLRAGGHGHHGVPVGPLRHAPVPRGAGRWAPLRPGGLDCRGLPMGQGATRGWQWDRGWTQGTGSGGRGLGTGAGRRGGL